ncbi:MAG: methylamine dehydrogenase accessory protein MauD [Myxococcota bacterium]|jgi:methylamine dehydrogenase accessory protein MauD
MTEGLMLSNILLWIAVVALGVVVLALLRQVGILHDRIAPAGALVGSEEPRVGERGPILDLEDWSGHPVRVGGDENDGASTLLFFLSPTCPVCKELLPVVRRLRGEDGAGLRVVLASDGAREEHLEFVERERLEEATYVLSGVLGRSYQVGRLPYAVLLDAAGFVRARGLVNSREHLESLFEAQARGVASLQEYLARDRVA